ncbi:unnamed protein product (macronuclear) [Paramecium tetraurelia]|uniref:HECT domain-containing protein n=1 Tax=Paramecium tetraurelia TaxID=5888 RepID=A0DLH0_PARTE|nr:uncharacterized protein GSPATT00018204001 [Paramecium tetraurelia]CAK83887.1 unnamed protein product [Paramecium tetraurelia]|eukprot:XP_001451284.1 hypothetical protein (macronuclear) [Paramecium tetraurelia strain d4-2]
MGCCLSAANQIKEPEILNNKPIQISHPQIQQQDIQNNQVIEEDINEDERKRYVQKKKDAPPPSKYPKPMKKDIREDIQFEIPQQPIEPQKPKLPRNQKLHKLIQLGREYVGSLHHNSETDKQIISEIELQTFEKTLTLEELNNISQKYEKSLTEILFLKCCTGITLLELILINIDNFEIITYLLLEQKLHINDDLYYIAIRIINKIKPLRKSDNQVQQQINFLKAIRESNQVRELVHRIESVTLFNGIQNFESEFNFKNRYHLKLLGTIVKILKNFQIDSTLEQIYCNAKIDHNFTNSCIPKSIPKGESKQVNSCKIELKYLKMNIFHQIALNKDWTLFKQYSNNYYQQPDISGMTPFMIFFERAPINIILEYITDYPSQLKQAIKYSTSQGKNIAHCISMNKDISEENEAILMNILSQLSSCGSEEQMLKQLLLQPYNDFIPLISYLDSHKVGLNSVCQFLSQFITKEFDLNKLHIQANIHSNQIKNQRRKDLKQNENNVYPSLYERFYRFKKYGKTLAKQYPQKKPLTQYDNVYLHYIQLAKQVIKKDFKVKFDWINNFNIYTSYFPYDIGTTQQSLMNMLLRNGNSEQVKQGITQVIQLMDSGLNLDVETPNGFSLQAQLLAELISLKREQKQYPYQTVFDMIDSVVIEQINQQPKLLIASIFGNTDFRRTEYQSIYSYLVQLKDQKLLEGCLTAQLLFDINQNTKYELLMEAFELKQLNSKDHLLKKILDSIQIRARIHLTTKKDSLEIVLNDKSQPKEDEVIYTINFSTLIQLDFSNYQSKRTIIQQLKESDDKKDDQQHTFRVKISYHNILIFYSQSESQKTFIEILKHKHFRSFTKFWILKDKINFHPQLFINEDYFPNVTIDNLTVDQYESAFDWQILGISAKIINSTFPIKEDKLTHKQKVIRDQIVDKIDFVNALAQSNKLSLEFQGYIQICQKEHKDRMNLIYNIWKMIEAEAFDNIMYLNSLLTLRQYDHILITIHTFLFQKNIKRQTCQWDDQDVLKYNQILSKLLDLKFPEKEDDHYNPIRGCSLNIITLFSPQNWQRFNENTKYLFYSYIKEWSYSQEQHLCVLLSSPKDQQVIYPISQNIIKNKKMPKNPNLISLILEYYLKQSYDEEELGQIQNFFITLFQSSEQLALKYLNQMKLKKNQIYILYGNVLRKSQSTKSLNQLLHFCENNSIVLDNQIYQTPLKCPEGLENYYKALSKPYYIVFTLSQYQEFYKQIPLTMEQKTKHLQLFLENGLHEKLQFILSQGDFSFETYSTAYFQMVKSYLEEQLSIKFDNQDTNEDEAEEMDENGNQTVKKTNKYLFFDLKPNELKFKQLRNKKTKLELKQEAQKIVDEFCKTNNMSLLKTKYVKKVHNIQKTLNHQQNQSFGSQMQDRSPLFMNSGGQKVDFLKCIEIVQKQFNPKKVKSKQIIANYEYYSNLLYPKKQKIEKYQAIITTLLQVFKENRFPNSFLSSRAQGYIDLYNANANLKQAEIEFEFPQRFTSFQKQFFLEILLSLRNESQNETANLILSQQHENMKCVKFLQKNLSELENIRFNSTTLYYVTKQVELLKSNSYSSEIFNYYKESEKIKTTFYNLQYTSNELTKNQVFLRKGRHDHITKQSQFTQNHLVAAIMSNNYASITYALNLHAEPVKCGLTNNVFQILIIQQCENNIIKYFNSFVKGKVQAYEKLLSLNNIPILYYVFFKKMEKVFAECFLAFLTNLIGKQKTYDVIKSQLQLSSNLTEYKVYQIALMNKCYYVLNYLDGIITQDDLKLISSPYILKCQIRPDKLEENSKEEQFYKKYFELLSLAQQELHWPEFERKKKKEKQQENKNKVGEGEEEEEGEKKKKPKKKKKKNKKGKKKVTSKQKTLPKKSNSFYIKDKQINELILFEQACINSVFKLKAEIELKNTMLSLALSENKWECLEKYKYPEHLFIQLITEQKSKNQIQNLDQSLFQNIFKNCLQYQILNSKLVIELCQINPQLLLKVLKAIQVTLDIAVILYAKLKDTPELDNFLSYHSKMYKEYIRIPQNGVPIEDEVIEQEEEHPIPREYMKPSVAYILMLLHSIKQDNYNPNLLKKQYISIPLFQKTYDLLKQQLNQQSLSQIQFTNNTLQFLKDFSEVTLNIEKDRFFESLNFQENALEIVVLKSMIQIKQIETIIENFKAQCSWQGYYQKEKKHDKQIKNRFQIYFGDEDIKFSSECYEIYLTFENNQFNLSQDKIDRILTFFKQKEHKKNLDEQPILLENILQHKTVNNKQVNLSKFDLRALNSIDFDDINYENCINQILELTKPQGRCGQYEIDDLFAPHQHEQIRQPELSQQMSIQQPVLQRQQSSQMGQSLGALSLSKQVSTSKRQKLREDFQFMLELLPDNTYQVRQRHKKQNQKEIIFSEFYQFQQPNVKLNVIKLSEKEFIEQYDSRKTISILVQDLYKYNEYLGNLIEGQKQLEEWVVDFPFYIQNNSIKFSDCLFTTYSIQCIFNKLFNFVEKVRTYSSIDKKDNLKLIWRINATSFLEVFISKLIDQQSQKYPLVEIYSLIDALLEWKSLAMIFNTLIYHNLEQAQQVLKVIRGVYVEFNEISDLAQQHCQFVDTNCHLDKTFLFGNTTYLLQNQILIIRLNVKIEPNSSQITQIKNNIMLPDTRIQLYYNNILNIYDFFNQIFSADQLVQFIFNKLQVDGCLLNYSNEISSLINKTVTFSVDHSQLQFIFSGEIMRVMSIKNNETRLKEFESIWYILNKLYCYFTTDLYRYLENSFINEKFNTMFYIRLHCLLNSIKHKKNLNEILNSNTRQLFKSKGGFVIEKVCNLNKQICSTKNSNIDLQFGFQLTTSFYVSNCKLGDICAVFYSENSKLNLIFGQLVCKTKPGSLIFHILTDNLPKGQEEIVRLQQAYQIGMNNQSVLSISLEDLQAIVLFQSNWPSDPLFNNSILNLFITDMEKDLFICNEKNFIKHMIEIQNEVDENVKQEKIDNLFGVGLASSYSDITVSQMTPTFVDQINFDFISINSLKRQQSVIQPNTVFIRINEDTFVVDPIPTQPINTACYFESNIKGYKLQGELNNFVKQHEEFREVFLIFDDELDNQVYRAADRIIAENSGIISFIKGYEQFLSNKNQSSINSSLQMFFEVQSISSIKIRIIQNLITKIEIIFAPFKHEGEALIKLKDQTLQVYSLLGETKIIYPEIDEVSNFFYNLIINYRDHHFESQITNDNQIQINFKRLPDLEFIKVFVDIVLIAQYFHKLVCIIDKENQIKAINIQHTDEITTNNKYSFYQFTDDMIIINYCKYFDFSFSNFILDYLNRKQINQINKVEQNLTFSGSQILEKQVDLIPKTIFSGLNQTDQVELLSIIDMNMTIHNQDKANPLEFKELILIPKVNGFYNNLFYFKSFQHPTLTKYNNQKQNKYQVGDEVHFLLHPINSQISLDQQLQKLKVRVGLRQTKQKKYTLSQLIFQTSEEEQLITNCLFLSNNVMLVTIKSESRLKISIYSTSSITLSQLNYQFSRQLNFQYQIQTVQDLEKTLHVSVTHGQKTIKVKLEKDDHTTYGKGNRQLMKILSKEAKNNKKEIYQSTESTTHSSELQSGNTINMISNQDIAAATRAGVLRKDYIEFRDSNCNVVEQFTCEKVSFVHSIFYQIQYVPEKERAEEGLNLIWTPTFKGIYHLLIDNVKIEGRFVVLANVPNLEKSTIEIQDNLEVIPFCEKILISFYLKDKFENCYGDTENQIFSESNCNVKQVSGNQSKLNLTFNNLTKVGSLNAYLTFDPIEVLVLEDTSAVEFYINNQLKKSQIWKLSGLGLDKRRQRFQQAINQVWKPTSYNLNISRVNFLEDLLELAEKKLNYQFSIKFNNEPGIDAGGLKREFYDMIGNTLKDENYKFFSPVSSNQSKYFLHPKFNKQKNKERYALLFGKLIANAICNSYLIGIDIIAPFWKVVFDERIVFTDLSLIWDKDTYNNYEKLKTMSEEDLESVCLVFTYSSGNTESELIVKGSQTNVTKKNLDLYLNKTAEYVIHKQFDKIYKSFIEGFQSVLDISVQYCEQNLEMSLLTQGLLEIKSEILLQKFTFSGGKPQHKSYFETYVSQASPETLKNMLKFITGNQSDNSLGSSSIPFDQSSYVISVRFESGLSDRKLPLSHTCFKSIEVPLYKSFAELKQKLDIAFTIGFEGYGFG